MSFGEILFKYNVKPLFEQVLREARLRETVVVEAGKIYVTQTEDDKLKSIDELWEYYENYATNQIKENKRWQIITVENTDALLKVEIYPKSINEILSHTPKQENFRPKILCFQAIPYIVQKMHHITQENERKNRPQNEYWYCGFCDITVDKIPYKATVKLVKKVNVKNPRFYIYFLNDLILEKK
jgi:hypothetical protein